MSLITKEYDYAFQAHDTRCNSTKVSPYASL